MATVHSEEFMSASEFKKTLIFFTRKDYETDHADPENPSTPYGYKLLAMYSSLTN